MEGSTKTTHQEIVGTLAPLRDPVLSGLDAEAHRIAVYLRRALADAAAALSEEQYRHLDYAGDRLERLRIALHALDELAAIDGGPPAERVALYPLVSDIVERMIGAVRDRGGMVIVGRLPQVWGCRPQLERMFEELIDNATRYTGGGPPVIRIQGEVRDGFATLEVADTGRGIPAHYAGTVFDPMVTLEADGEAAGVGLGLTLCRRVAERFGGSIEAATPETGGCAVRVTLPTEPPSYDRG